VSAGLKVIVGGSLCVSAGWWLAGPVVDQTRITFLSVGQGDCAVIQHKGRTILVDAAPTVASAKWDVLPKLRELGVVDVDLILLTHPDTDHIGGVPVLARAFPKAKFAISEEFRDHSAWQAELKEWRLSQSRLSYLPRRMSGLIGDLKIDIYCPEVWSEEQDNDGSIFLKISTGSASAVLSGDATAESEAVAAANGDWSAQIMKAGHHGSKTSTSFGWLNEVKPKHVVVSCGKDNRYGHPHASVLERVSSAKAEIERTDQGDVSFVIRDGAFRLQE
jgi:beta-lactamase superfamily II metal-dependent hydrolase